MNAVLVAAPVNVMLAKVMAGWMKVLISNDNPFLNHRIYLLLFIPLQIKKV